MAELGGQEPSYDLSESEKNTLEAKLREEAVTEFGILKPVPVAALERSDVKLGQALFWDARLSADGKTACASCRER